MQILSEKSRTLAWISLILVIGFLTTNFVGYEVSRDSIRRGITEHTLPLTGDNIYSEIQKDILRPVFISSLMANDTFLRDWILNGERDPSQITHYLKEVQQKYGTVTSFLVSERSRKYYISKGVLKSVQESEPRDKWYFRVRGMKQPYETNVDPDLAARDTMTIFINYRVLDYQGNFIGATGVGLALNAVNRIIDSYQERFRRRIYFVDPMGTIMLAGKSMEQERGSIRTQPGVRDIADAILNRSSKPTQLEYRMEDSITMVNSRFIPELGWYLVVEQDEREELTPLKQVLGLNLAISTAITLLVLIITLLAVNRYQARLAKAAQSALSGAAAESALAREQQQFVAMVSHEFRTPLATIDACLQSLQRLATGMPDEVLSRHQKIRRASQRLQALIDNHLTEDRLKQAQEAPRMEQVDLFGLVTRTAWRAEWRNMTVHVDELPATIRGDTELLRIAGSNLIDNAIKYSPEGGNIRIEGKRVGNFAEISTTDSGIGISPEDLPRIFEKYYRAEGNKTGGTGLGLYLVKRIVELHGGTITAESVLGQGTTIRVRLPIDEV